MDLKTRIEGLVQRNEYQIALKHLKQQEISLTQKNILLSLQQTLNAIENDKLLQLDSRENIQIRYSQLLQSILELTNRIVTGEPEIATKSPIKKLLTETHPKYLIGSILILEIIIGLLGELMPDEIKSVLEGLVGKENYLVAWCITIGLTVVLLLYLTFRKEKPKAETTKENLLAEEKDKITQTLLKRYESRLIQKTDRRLPVDLKLTYSKEGTSDDYKHWHDELKELYQKNIRATPKATLFEITKHFKQLLIIGKPGAGKSTQLLELAIDWLKADDCPQIPVIFNLAPWKSTDKHFHSWLEGALVSGYGFSKVLAKEAIDKNQILPLLDGLDEVGTNEKDDAAKNTLRSHCLKAIDRYLLLDVPYVVICSRIDEYTTASNAPVKAEILINPLTPKQIKETLTIALSKKLENKDENAAKNLLDIIQNHPTLETTLCTPFYYNIALDVFDERISKLDLPNTEKELEQYLIKQYLEKKLTTTDNPHAFKKDETKHYLSFLAYFVNIANIKNFELTSFEQLIFSRVSSKILVLGIVLGFVFFLAFFLAFSLVVGLFYGLVVGLVAFVVGLFYGLMIGLADNFLDYLSMNYVDFLKGSFGASIIGLFVELSINNYTFNSIEKPYYRLKSNIFSEIINPMVLTPLVLIFIKYCSGDIQLLIDLYIWLFFGLVLGFILGFTSTRFFNHFISRICLRWEKVLPLRWVSFFTYASKARILEQDGGQWLFRHQILQDYFFEEWKKKNQ